MADLEKQIASWRREMFAAGIKDAEVLDELESHLRDDVELQMRSGAEMEAAFASAVQHIGQPQSLKKEFRKVARFEIAAHRIKQFIFTFAGIPNLQFATTMNTSNSNLEPAWATYIKAGIFLLPALSLWVFAILFLMPQLRLMHLNSGGHEFPMLINVMIAISAHGFFFCGAVILALVGLEWRAEKWPRYRKAAIAIGAWLINSTVLATGFLMVFLALLAAMHSHRA